MAVLAVAAPTPLLCMSNAHLNGLSSWSIAVVKICGGEAQLVVEQTPFCNRKEVFLL